jgi:hypothetical protein
MSLLLETEESVSEFLSPRRFSSSLSYRLDLSGLGDPAASNATAGLVLRVTYYLALALEIQAISDENKFVTSKVLRLHYVTYMFNFLLLILMLSISDSNFTAE